LLGFSQVSTHMRRFVRMSFVRRLTLPTRGRAEHQHAPHFAVQLLPTVQTLVFWGHGLFRFRWYKKRAGLPIRSPAVAEFDQIVVMASQWRQAVQPMPSLGE
jgi:hypothetical protein